MHVRTKAAAAAHWVPKQPSHMSWGHVKTQGGRAQRAKVFSAHLDAARTYAWDTQTINIARSGAKHWRLSELVCIEIDDTTKLQ